MLNSILLYGCVLTVLIGASAIYWRRCSLGWSFAKFAMASTLCVVLPATLVAVAIPNFIATIVVIVVAEEFVRWFIVTKSSNRPRKRDFAIGVGIVFGLIETSNWLFIEKAQVSLDGYGLSSIGYMIADAAYIVTEFVAGIVVHGGLTALLLLVYGADGNRERLALGVMMTTIIHFIVNIVVMSA